MRIEKIFCTGHGWVHLIIDKKTALVDCAMSLNKDEVIPGLKALLGERKLDYVLLTHSHFDHIGCLSEIRKAYPDVKVIASAKTAKVFTSEGAKALMQHMTDIMSDARGLDRVILDTDGLYVDTVVGDGDEIDLGTKFKVLETKGHTDCCISFWCEEEKTLFASESIGVWYGKYPINLEICKGYRDVLASIAKQRALGVEKLYIPHSGLFTYASPNEYFSMAEHCMIYYKDIVYTAFADGKTDEEIYLLCKRKIYDVMVENGIPMNSYDRWLVNTKAFVSFARKDYEVMK